MGSGLVKTPTLSGKGGGDYLISCLLLLANVKEFAQETGAACVLRGQGSEVHWNLQRNLFVKTILNYCHFLTKLYFGKLYTVN